MNQYEGLTQEQKIEVTNIFDAMFSRFGEEKLFEMRADLNKTLEEYDKVIVESAREFVEKKANVSFDKLFSDTFNYKLGGTISKMNHLDAKLEAMSGLHVPANVFARLNDIEIKMNVLMAELREFARKSLDLICDLSEKEEDSKPPIEITNDELRFLFINSGLTLMKIASKFNVSEGTASKWVNGVVEDYTMRKDLKRYLKREIKRAKLGQIGA